MENLNLMIRKYLRKFGYKTTPVGVQKMLDAWTVNKASLLEKFRTHPNWNEDALAIVLPNTEYEKMFSNESLKKFGNWIDTTMPEFQQTKASEEISERVYINKLDDLRAMLRYSTKNSKKVEIDGEDVRIINEKTQKEYDDYIEKVKDLIKIDEDDEKSYYITAEFKRNIDEVLDAMRYIRSSVTTSTIDEAQATEINRHCNIGAANGQKLSRVINKLCTKIGLNEFRKPTTFTDEQGVEHTRDIGYQHQFNVMAEEIQARTYKVHTIISLNPLDYLGMSIGTWSSCQGIDLFHILHDGRFHGEWSSGTISLMLDKATVVYYTIKEDYEGNLYFDQDKINRCLFSIGSNGKLLVQHVVYPDSRDGGDPNKVKQYRNIMQEIVSQLYGYENKWQLRKGTEHTRQYVRNVGTHYPDTIRNSNSNISYITGSENEIAMIEIGHKPICPVCGKEHSNEGNIMCYDCKNINYKASYAIKDIFTNPQAHLEDEEVIIESNINEEDVNNAIAEEVEQTVFCDGCGNSIDREDALEIEGHYYCDEDCAETDGWHLINDEWVNENDADLVETEDDGWQYECDCYEDYNGNWHLGEPAVTAEDGTNFATYDDAYEADYDMDENGNWYPTDEMHWYERGGYNVHYDNCIEMDDGSYFANEDEAEENGYRLTANNEWLKEDEVFFDEYENDYYSYEDDEVIEINGRYYATSASAENDGYVEIEGSWYREDEVFFDELTSTHFTADNAEVHTEDGNYFLFETSAVMAGYRETENGWVKVEEARESA